MLIVHHLGHSQSERIVWLCEELALPYELKLYKRDPVTILAPPEMRALHPIGAAPVITDGSVTLAESTAIVEYILARYGNGRLAPGSDQPEFADYLYWLHFTNGTLQPVMGRNMIVNRLQPPADNPTLNFVRTRLGNAFRHVDQRLNEAPYLAGREFTAADIMIVFSLTTMRLFMPLDLAPYPHILAYLQRIGARPGYQRAMAKGDPDLKPMLT